MRLYYWIKKRTNKKQKTGQLDVSGTMIVPYPGSYWASSRRFHANKVLPVTCFKPVVMHC